VPRADAVHIGWPVFAFGSLAAVIAAGVAGLLTAARASLPDRIQGLKGTRTTAGRNERRLLGAVATVQIVLTVALLAGAALLIRTARNLDRMQPGYDTGNILAMTVTTMFMERQKSVEFHKLALERVASVPGVIRAAFAWGVPLTGNKVAWRRGGPRSVRLVEAGRSHQPSVAVDHAGLFRRHGHGHRGRARVPRDRRPRRAAGRHRQRDAGETLLCRPQPARSAPAVCRQHRQTARDRRRGR
jgi:hypothetical protein